MDERIRKRLGAHMTEWRDRTGINQPELAKRCKIDYKRYGIIERGDAKEPRPSELERLALIDATREIGVDWIGLLPNVWAAMRAQEESESQNGDGDRQQTTTPLVK